MKHVTPGLCRLCWLPFSFWVQFRAIILISKALYGWGPSYLINCLFRWAWQLISVRVLVPILPCSYPVELKAGECVRLTSLALSVTFQVNRHSIQMYTYLPTYPTFKYTYWLFCQHFWLADNLSVNQFLRLFSVLIIFLFKQSWHFPLYFLYFSVEDWDFFKPKVLAPFKFSEA